MLLSDFDRAMREASVGRTATDTDVHAFLHINIRTGRYPGQKTQSDIMTLLKHLNNEKSAHVETTAMQYPTSQPVHTSPILGSLKHPIIRSALLLIILLFSSFSALAYECEVDGIYYNLNSTDKTAGVAKGNHSGEVVIPKTIAYNGATYSVTSIGGEAFSGCSGLTSVIFNAEKCTEMNSPFSGCTNLRLLTIGDKVTIIPSSAFSGCSGLTSVVIPNSATSIGDNTFIGCSGLSSVVVDKNNVKYDSRDNCNAIIETSTNKLVGGRNNTTIPNSVTAIGEDAFYDCCGLTKLVSLAVEPPTCGYPVFEGVDKTACQLVVPDESINRYKVADQWKDFMNILGTSGVDDVSVGTPDAVYEVYNLQGVCVAGGMREAEITADALPHGVYILVSPQGRKKLKI